MVKKKKTNTAVIAIVIIVIFVLMGIVISYFVRNVEYGPVIKQKSSARAQSQPATFIDCIVLYKECTLEALSALQSCIMINKDKIKKEVYEVVKACDESVIKALNEGKITQEQAIFWEEECLLGVLKKCDDEYDTKLYRCEEIYRVCMESLPEEQQQ